MRVARHVKLTRKIWREADRIVQGRSKIIEPFMATGVGAARYINSNSDLPVCISQDFLHIQTVTGLVFHPGAVLTPTILDDFPEAHPFALDTCK